MDEVVESLHQNNRSFFATLAAAKYIHHRPFLRLKSYSLLLVQDIFIAPRHVRYSFRAASRAGNAALHAVFRFICTFNRSTTAANASKVYPSY